jgi:hypothetical protein
VTGSGETQKNNTKTPTYKFTQEDEEKQYLTSLFQSRGTVQNEQLIREKTLRDTCTLYSTWISLYYRYKETVYW